MKPQENFQVGSGSTQGWILQKHKCHKCSSLCNAKFLCHQAQAAWQWESQESPALGGWGWTTVCFTGSTCEWCVLNASHLFSKAFTLERFYSAVAKIIDLTRSFNALNRSSQLASRHSAQGV